MGETGYWSTVSALAIATMLACGGVDTTGHPSDADLDHDVASDHGPVAELGAPQACLCPRSVSTDDGNGADAEGTTRDPTCPPTHAWISEARGRVVDTSKTPVGSAFAVFCITSRTGDGHEVGRCLDTPCDAATGEFSIQLAPNEGCISAATLSINPKAPTDKTKMFCRADLPEVVELIDFGDVTIFGTEPASEIPPLGDGDLARTVTFSDGLELDVIPNNFWGDYEQLAATTMTPNADGMCEPEREDLLFMVYTVRPQSNLRSGTVFPMRVPNAMGLAPGARVKLWVLGAAGSKLPDGTRVGEGLWQPYAYGVVREDGAAITGELPFLNWFAYGPE